MGAETDRMIRTSMKAADKHSGNCFRYWVVSPEGRIKTIYIDVNVSSPILKLERAFQSGRCVGFEHVDISHRYRADGWHSLRDLYEAEGRLGDWETFKLYQREAKKRAHKQEIPDAYLPDRVLEMRANAPKRSKLELPPPQSAAGDTAREIQEIENDGRQDD